MPLCLFCKNITKCRKSLFPGIKLHVLESQKDHRISALVVSILLSAGPYFFIPEIHRSIFITSFKISAQHIHIKCLAKTPGAGKKCYHGAFINKVFYHHRLVDVIVL